MKLFSRIFTLAGILMVLSASGWALPIVLNGSFETNVLASPFFGNASTVTDWTFSGAGDGPHWAVGYFEGPNASITTAGAGNQFVTMGGGGTVGTSTWSQVVGGFTVGQAYILSFMLAGETTSDANQVVTASVIGGGTQQGNFTAPASGGGANYWRTWQAFNLSFTALAASETIQFSSTTIHDVGLDAVGISVATTGTPEPGTFGLLGAGIAALALIRRKRQ